ncbi:MAG: hypothetical protein H6739_17315 [Alphaproteobacteria bacterium]|nr:hypothetical protein [Alphaproteobacteria bacterium]
MSPLALLLLGCGIGDRLRPCDEGSRMVRGACVPLQDADVDVDVDCDLEVEDVYPGLGATDHDYRDPVEWTLSRPDDSAQAWIEDVPGFSFLGAEPHQVVFVPDEPLDPLTTYDAALAFCGGQQEARFSFTTSSLGTPTAASPVGTLYSLDPSAGEIIVPPGMGPVMEALLDGFVLIEVLSVGEDQVELRLAATPDGSTQDLCAPTWTVTADYDDPHVSFGPADQDLRYGDVSMTLGDFGFEGDFSADGATLGGVSAWGLVDTRPLNGGQGAADVCELMAGFGVACEPCPSDGGEFCLGVRIRGMEAVAISGVLTPVEGDCHEDCQDAGGACAPPGCACGSAGRPAGSLLVALLALAGLRRRR